MKFKLVESFKSKLDILNELQKQLDNFDYAFIDKEGNELDSEDAMNAVVQTPDSLAKLGKGVCTDYVEYSRDYLDKNNIPYSVYDVSFIDEDGDRPAHIFIVVKDGSNYVWVENAWHSEKGNHKYSSLNQLFKDISYKHCVYDGKNYLNTCSIREIPKSLAGMSQRAIDKYIRKLPIIYKPNLNESLTPKIKRRDNENDFSPFGYQVDFYDNDNHIGTASVCGIKDNNAFLYDLEVFPEYRGKGYGNDITKFMIDKYDIKQLYVRKDNTKAINLYKKFGFEITDDANDQEYLMER